VAIGLRGLSLNKWLGGRVKGFVNAATFRSRARYWWRKEIRWWILIGLVVFSLRSSLADWNDVPTGSMKPTILEGDRVLVNKLAYDLKVAFTTRHLAEWSNPHRGDVVVFFSPHDGARLVKRVVGVPGDIIELRNDGLILNGQAVEYRPIAEELLRGVAPADRARQV
jgi:signal peptidase I